MPAHTVSVPLQYSLHAAQALEKTVFCHWIWVNVLYLFCERLKLLGEKAPTQMQIEAATKKKKIVEEAPTQM